MSLRCSDSWNCCAAGGWRDKSPCGVGVGDGRCSAFLSALNIWPEDFVPLSELKNLSGPLVEMQLAHTFHSRKSVAVSSNTPVTVTSQAAAGRRGSDRRHCERCRNVRKERRRDPALTRRNKQGFYPFPVTQPAALFADPLQEARKPSGDCSRWARPTKQGKCILVFLFLNAWQVKLLW